LQAAIASQAAVGKVAQQYIPTPETNASSIRYDDLYPPRFSQPATYIRFSSTVEDCTGCPYNMSEEDDAFLQSLNAKSKDASTQCSEDQFEVVMNFFEETAKTQQPFSNISDTPVLTLEEMVSAFDETVIESTRVFAKDVYEYWRARRIENENRPLQPTLTTKVIESSNDSDDSDPYICFRRREHRNVRKTRGRDAQSVDKLKKLRKELEEARHLVSLVRQREMAKKELIEVERMLWEQRRDLTKLKRNLPEQYRSGDAELLVDQKVGKFVLTGTHKLTLSSQRDYRLEIQTHGTYGLTTSFLSLLLVVLSDLLNIAW
jgi:enhancer of polycomb-like protein